MGKTFKDSPNKKFERTESKKIKTLKEAGIDFYDALSRPVKSNKKRWSQF